MKKVFILSAILFSGIMLAGCGSKEETLTCTYGDYVRVYVYNDKELLSYSENGVQWTAEERVTKVLEYGTIDDFIELNTIGMGVCIVTED